MKCMCLPYLTIIGVLRSPKVPVTQLCILLRQVLLHTMTQYNVNWLIIKLIEFLCMIYLLQKITADNSYLCIPLTAK